MMLQYGGWRANIVWLYFSKELVLGSNPGALNRENKDCRNVQTYMNVGFITAIEDTYVAHRTISGSMSLYG